MWAFAVDTNNSSPAPPAILTAADAKQREPSQHPQQQPVEGSQTHGHSHLAQEAQQERTAEKLLTSYLDSLAANASFRDSCSALTALRTAECRLHCNLGSRKRCLLEIEQLSHTLCQQLFEGHQFSLEGPLECIRHLQLVLEPAQIVITYREATERVAAMHFFVSIVIFYKLLLKCETTFVYSNPLVGKQSGVLGNLLQELLPDLVLLLKLPLLQTQIGMAMSKLCCNATVHKFWHSSQVLT